MNVFDEVKNMSNAELSQAYDETWQHILGKLINTELYNEVFRFKCITDELSRRV